MLNRTNRTLSANLNRLNLGTRSLALAASVNNGSSDPAHPPRPSRVVMRAGMLGVFPIRRFDPIRRTAIPVDSGLILRVVVARRESRDTTPGRVVADVVARRRRPRRTVVADRATEASPARPAANAPSRSPDPSRVSDRQRRAVGGHVGPSDPGRRRRDEPRPREDERRTSGSSPLDRRMSDARSRVDAHRARVVSGRFEPSPLSWRSAPRG